MQHLGTVAAMGRYTTTAALPSSQNLHKPTCTALAAVSEHSCTLSFASGAANTAGCTPKLRQVAGPSMPACLTRELVGCCPSLPASPVNWLLSSRT